jgi:AraC family transcriptional regulator of adaptative response/methylated-DNA-[protein]-cysteine methyltransferase
MDSRNLNCRAGEAQDSHTRDEETDDMQTDTRQQSKDYQRIEKALQFAAEHFREQPTLAELAECVHLSEHHFQRVFSRWAGVSPKQFLQYLTAQHARQCLAANMSVLDASLDSGLAAPARLYELFVRIESVTPADYKAAGAGLQIEYGFHATPFGQCLIGITTRGITHMAFVDAVPDHTDNHNTADENALSTMKQRLPAARYTRNQTSTAVMIQRAFARTYNTDKPLTLLVSGTAFQVKVWEAMLRIEPGQLASYQQLASAIGKPKAMRAVGTAVSQNPVAMLIPCHRVIRSNGMLGEYRWGGGRKLAIHGWEQQAAQNS